jgi:hypothetical protein
VSVDLYKVVFVFKEERTEVPGVTRAFGVREGYLDPADLVIVGEEKRVFPGDAFFFGKGVGVVLFADPDKDTFGEFGVLKDGFHGKTTSFVPVRSDGDEDGCRRKRRRHFDFGLYLYLKIYI